MPGQFLDKQVAVYPAIAGPKFQIIFLRDRPPLDLGTHAVGDQPIDIFIDLLDLLHRGDLQFCDIRGGLLRQLLYRGGCTRSGGAARQQYQ
ncbi:Uncharacterised protein [uncultured Blautia sp.]|nr:Uncharacterised protein [uncultured Blautia sp.]